jgi:PAT family acetyl-CoA transporter-like MFS transporter 1
MCTMPYSFKVFWSPIVELYHIPGYPKRKSWVVPTQLIGSCILFFLSFEIEEMLATKNVYYLLGCLMVNTFIITCQDIAVDSWAVEMLHPNNSSYASSAQSVGHKLGSLISSSLFLALNDVEFCNVWFNATPKEKPMLTIPTFLFIWAFC